MALTGNEIEQLKDIIDKVSLSQNLTQSQRYSLYYMSNVNNFSINFARKLFDDNFNPYPNIEYYKIRFLYLRRNKIFIRFILKIFILFINLKISYLKMEKTIIMIIILLKHLINLFKYSNDFIIYYKSKYPFHYNRFWFYNWFIPNSFQINIVAEYLSLIDLPFLNNYF